MKTGMDKGTVTEIFFVTEYFNAPVIEDENQKNEIMELVGIGLIVFSVVLLVSLIYYMTTSTRHKERLISLEKGLDPEIYTQRFKLESLRAGFAFIGIGTGLFVGVLLESSNAFSSNIELPLYFAPVMICVGIALTLYYKLIK